MSTPKPPAACWMTLAHELHQLALKGVLWRDATEGTEGTMARLLEERCGAILEAADAVVYGSCRMNAMSASTSVSDLLKYHKLRNGWDEIPEDDEFRKRITARATLKKLEGR